MKLPCFRSRNLTKDVPAIDIVATKTPDGMVVRTEFAVVTNPADEWVGVINARAAGVLDGMSYMRGDEVGLEWQTLTGVKLRQSDEWAKSTYIPVTPITGKERISRYGQPLSPAAAEHESAKEHRNQDINFKTAEYEAWLDEFNEMCDYVERVKKELYWKDES